MPDPVQSARGTIKYTHTYKNTSPTGFKMQWGREALYEQMIIIYFIMDAKKWNQETQKHNVE